MWRCALAVGLLLLLKTPVHAGLVIADIDFDSAFPGAYSIESGFGGGGSMVTYNPHAPGATGKGGAFTISSLHAASDATLLRVGFTSNQFDFSRIPGVTLGNLSQEQFANIRFTFDLNMVGATQLQSITLLSGAPGTPRGELGLPVLGPINASAGQGFQPYAINFASLDQVAVSKFLQDTNQGNRAVGPTTDFYFEVALAPREGFYQAGDQVVFDNLKFTSVPEPSSLIAAMAILGGAYRVRRRCKAGVAVAC
jgi:hypothetical protein